MIDRKIFEKIYNRIEQADNNNKMTALEDETYYIGMYYVEKGEEKEIKDLFVTVVQNDITGDKIKVICDEDGRIMFCVNSKGEEITKKTDFENLIVDTEVVMKAVGSQSGEDGRRKEKDLYIEAQNAQEDNRIPKEQEDIEPNVSKETEDEEDEEKEYKMNYRGKINLENSPQIPLNQIVNGYFLYEQLQLEDKLRGKTKEPISRFSLESGFLSTVPSKELKKYDNKKREFDDSLVILTSVGDIIELDEDILKPVKLEHSNESEKQSENSGLQITDDPERDNPNYEKRWEVDQTKTEGYSDHTRTALYEIPMQNKDRLIGESGQRDQNYYLEIRNLRVSQVNGQVMRDREKKKICFAQQERLENQYENREGRVKNIVSREMRDRYERYEIEDKSEEIENHKLEEPGTKAQSEIDEYINKIIEKCKEKCPKSVSCLNDVEFLNGIKENIRKQIKQGAKNESQIIKSITEQIKNRANDEYRNLM